MYKSIAQVKIEFEKSGVAVKILFVDNSPGMGGSIHHVASQIRQLHARGCEVNLIASKPELFAGLMPDNIKRQGLAWEGFKNVFESSGAMFKPVLPGVLNKPFSIAAYKRLQSALVPEFLEIIRSFSPDIVHINNLNLPNKVFGDVAKKEHIPLVISAMMIRLFSRTEAKFAAQADILLCVSQAVANYVAHLRGVCVERLRIVESPIDVSLYEHRRDASIRTDLGIPENAKLVLSLGRLTPWKGHDVLIRALGRLPEDVWLLQAGGEDEDWRKEIDKISVESGMEGRVVFAGVRSDVPALLAASDLLAHSSKFANPKEGEVEAFGRVVIEGMATCLPVVATDAGGPAQILRGTGAGRLVSPGDPEAMAKAIIFYLDNPKAAKQAGEKGRQVVGEKYTEEKLADKLKIIYDDLSGERLRQ